MTTRDFAIINDTHVGVVRSAGTTPVTASQLRGYAIEQLRALLVEATGCDLLINGDLFDLPNIPYTDLLEVYALLAQWLIDNPGCMLYLPPGNHDLSKTLATMSSQQFLTKLLIKLLPSRVIAMERGHAIEVAGHAGWVIPHMPNQEQFNIELEAVPKVKYLFVHCNYDNMFAVKSDHSLNMSKEQAQKLDVEYIVFGHEHQRKSALDGKVQIIGNQFPTSIADCLGNEDKYMAKVNENGLHYIQTWEGARHFQKVDWRDTSAAQAHMQFIRIEGDATASEAPAVVTAISKLRKAHSAFVITNAVSIEGRAAAGEMESLEKVANFNVTDALYKLLEKKNPKWAAKVAALSKEAENVS